MPTSASTDALRACAALAALALAACGGVATSASSPVGALAYAKAMPAATPGIGGLHVSGHTILDRGGHVVIPHGVDRSGTEYSCVQNDGIFVGPNDQTSVAAMASWHIDAVRVPLNEDCWLAINGVPAAYSGANYRNAIAAYVQLLNENGLIAILDLHWNAAGTALATGQQPMADADHAPAFWSSVAARFKKNLAVIFDLYNEPYGIPWSCWRDGGSASTCGTSYSVAGMNTLIEAVRDAGASNVVMAGGLSYANDLSQWLAYEPTDPAHELVASWHVYNFNSCVTTACYDDTIAPVAAQVPVIAGEIGESDCAHTFIDPLMTWLDAHGGGYLGWAWNADFACGGGPSLITNYDGTPTALGVGLRSHLATP
jgi:hypothetical protein